MKILVLNGPNLNLLGSRDRNTYGSNTLEQIRKKVNAVFPEMELEWYQSNHEGDLIDRIQQAKNDGFNGIVANWGGYTHTSVAIHDALKTVDIPKVEVHLSNIHGREEYREKSVTGRVMNGVITGFGSNSYILGIQAVKLITNKN
jgi:3-dehydroquinate dehydratase II